jgi:hypothetical protein
MQNSELYKGVEISFRDGYLHITHPDNFVLLPEDIDVLWMNLTGFCRQYDCRRILNEGRIDLSHLRAFDSYNAGSQAGEIEGLRMACLFHGYVPDEKAAFFQTVASNRGSKVEFFTDRAEALKWLGVAENE